MGLKHLKANFLNSTVSSTCPLSSSCHRSVLLMNAITGCNDVHIPCNCFCIPELMCLFRCSSPHPWRKKKKQSRIRGRAQHTSLTTSCKLQTVECQAILHASLLFFDVDFPILSA